jgi:type II secretory pathway pseudopilin PulG
MAIKLPRLLSGAPIVDDDGRPTLSFTRYWQQFAEQIERVFNTIAQILGITDQLDEALKQAQQAIETAQQAAQTAQDAADQAQQQTGAAKREAALQSSYIEPASVLTATPSLISIAAHTRYYSDGTSAAVNASTVAATSPDDIDYISYDDPERDGGTVIYVVSDAAPVQTGDTHVVGAVQIPNTGTADGGDGPQRPGYVRPRTLPEA